MPRKKDERNKEIGGKHRASSRYSMMVYRVTNTHLSKNKNYQGIEIRVSRSDFIEWFSKNDFSGCSVDRIDKSGHYELSNMQLISIQANIAKDKLKAFNGRSICYSCKQEKPLEDFVKETRRMHTGRSTICKPCESKRESNQSPEARLRALERMRANYYKRKAERSTGR